MTDPEKKIEAPMETGTESPEKKLEQNCAALDSTLRRYGIVPDPKQRDKMIPALFNQCKSVVDAHLSQARATMENALKLAKEHLPLPQEFTSLREELEEVHRALGFNFPKNPQDGVDTDAIFLLNNGTINLAAITRYRNHLTKWLQTPAPAFVQAAVGNTLRALEAYEDLQRKESFIRHPEQPIPVQLPKSVTEKKEDFAARLALAGVGGILGIATLGIALRRPDKDIRLPAFYLGLAALAAMGGRLGEMGSESLRREIAFLGKATVPYQTLVKDYSIRGLEWAKTAEKIRNLDTDSFSDAEKNIWNAMARGEAPTDPKERDFLLRKLGADTPAVREKLQAMITNGKDFVQFKNILQKSRSDEANAIVKECIKIGCDETAFKTFIDATKEVKKT